MMVRVLDIDDDIHHIEYRRLEYPNLMELITKTYYTEIGECRGRSLCGTCIVEVLEGFEEETLSSQETHTLEVNMVTDKKYRLACQILLDDKINGALFREVGTL